MEEFRAEFEDLPVLAWGHRTAFLAIAPNTK
jgi:hypothetical protein